MHISEKSSIFAAFCKLINDMKKTFVLMLLSIFSLGAMAQSPVYRIGDKYMMDGQMMNMAAFKGYLKNASPEAFALFDNGHKLSIAGWTCLSVGVVTNGVGSVMMRKYISGNAKKDASYGIGSALTSLGSGAATAGIVCLGVGYARMHKAANLYNIDKAKRPELNFAVVASDNGMGLAMQF